MNIDKASARLTDAPLAPANWSMELLKDRNHYTAEVRRSGVVMCRLTSSTPLSTDEATARRELADRARLWINDYLTTRSNGGG